MSIQFKGEPPQSAIANARRLADDLNHLILHGSPTDADLAGAPIIDLWKPAMRAGNALIGMVTGHPIIGDGRVTITSDLFAIDEHAGWARTWSRFYRLGRRVDLITGRPQ
jgi:hypothetical protein